MHVELIRPEGLTDDVPYACASVVREAALAMRNPEVALAAAVIHRT